MTSGGARNRSGPQADPTSGRSDRRGFKLTSLPSEGYDGEPPEWPLSISTLQDLIGHRELAIWTAAWRTPQACAWSLEPWRWETVAEYCRLKAVLEVTASGNAAQVGQIHRYRDQIGLSPAGLKENGWAIAQDEIGAKRVETSTPKKRASSRDRMKVVGGGE